MPRKKLNESKHDVAADANRSSGIDAVSVNSILPVAKPAPKSRKPRAATASAPSPIKPPLSKGSVIKKATVVAISGGDSNGTAGLVPLAEAVGSNGTGSHYSPDEVALRAYYLWIERGCPSGTAEQDWLEAERELQEA